MREQSCLCFACPFLIQVEIVLPSQASPQLRGRGVIYLLVTVHRKQGDELPLEKQLELQAAEESPGQHRMVFQMF